MASVPCTHHLRVVVDAWLASNSLHMGGAVRVGIHGQHLGMQLFVYFVSVGVRMSVKSVLYPRIVHVEQTIRAKDLGAVVLR